MRRGGRGVPPGAERPLLGSVAFVPARPPPVCTVLFPFPTDLLLCTTTTTITVMPSSTPPTFSPLPCRTITSLNSSLPCPCKCSFSSSFTQVRQELLLNPPGCELARFFLFPERLAPFFLPPFQAVCLRPTASSSGTDHTVYKYFLSHASPPPRLFSLQAANKTPPTAPTPAHPIGASREPLPPSHEPDEEGLGGARSVVRWLSESEERERRVEKWWPDWACEGGTRAGAKSVVELGEAERGRRKRRKEGERGRVSSSHVVTGRRIPIP